MTPTVWPAAPNAIMAELVPTHFWQDRGSNRHNNLGIKTLKNLRSLWHASCFALDFETEGQPFQAALAGLGTRIVAIARLATRPTRGFWAFFEGGRQTHPFMGDLNHGDRTLGPVWRGDEFE